MTRLHAFSLLALLAVASAKPPARPNVLFLFSDDQHADAVGALDNPHIRTPHIDRLVCEGVSFTNAYIMGASSPGVCLPSRASLLSGRTLCCVDGARHTQLFDLADDPHEMHNLAAGPAHAATLARLRKLLEQERVRLNDGTTLHPFSHKQGEAFWSAYETAKRP